MVKSIIITEAAAIIVDANIITLVATFVVRRLDLVVELLCDIGLVRLVVLSRLIELGRLRLIELVSNLLAVHDISTSKAWARSAGS